MLGHFCISWAFSVSQRPNPSPHPINKVGHGIQDFFSEFQLCYRLGEGELQENFEKDARFYEGTQK